MSCLTLHKSGLIMRGEDGHGCVNEPMLWREHIGRRVERDIAVLLSSHDKVSLGTTQVEITCLSAWHMSSERQHNMGSES